MTPALAPARPRRTLVALGLAAWLSASAGALGMVWLKSAASGERGDDTVRATFPAGTSIVLAADRPTVVLFAHPRCPCTQATMSELQRALQENESGPAQLEVRLFLPEHAEVDWARTSIWTRAEAMGAHVAVDRGGREAARFDARTSGMVLAYAPNGTLLFSGGVTSARGHEGDNDGREALRLALQHEGSRSSFRGIAAVFGCAL